MKILDQAVISAAEARPSITEWECSMEDWLTAGHPGDARKYLVRDGNVELRPSRDCPRGDIRPREETPRFPNCEACEPKHAEARQIIADLRERLEFCRAGNATLSECGADTARKLGTTRRDLADEKETSARMQRERDNADEVNAKLRGDVERLRTDLKSAMTCSAVTNGPLGAIRCERLRGDDHGQKHIGGGRKWDDDFSGPEFDCDECKAKDAEIARMGAMMAKSKARVAAQTCGLRWLDAIAWHECILPARHIGAHQDATHDDAHAVDPATSHAYGKCGKPCPGGDGETCAKLCARGSGHDGRCCHSPSRYGR